MSLTPNIISKLKNNNITKLYLDNDIDFLYLSDLIKNNTSLIKLKLNCLHTDINNIDILFKTLQYNTNIKVLYLNDVFTVFNEDIFSKLDIVLNELCMLICNNKTITKLHISPCNLCNKTELFYALSINNTIQYLYFDSLYIDNNIINIFCEMIINNKSIIKLLINDLFLMDYNKYYQNIFNAFNLNKYIQYLYISTGAVSTFNTNNTYYIDKINLCNNKDTSLTYLILKNTNIQDCNLLCDNLCFNDTVIKINLTNNHIYNIDSFYKALINNTTLLKLDLSYNKINNIKLLCEGLKNNKSLLSLKLSYNDIVNCEDLCEALINNDTLIKLTINNNKCRNIELFDDVFKYNTALTKLDLSNNIVSNNYFLNGLINNQSLTYLKLNSINSLKMLNYDIINKILSQNTTLNTLYLSHNNISSSKIHKLYNTLIQNTILTYLDLSYNYIYNPKLISKIIKHNSTLTNLDLSYNEITDNNNLILKSLNMNKSLTSLNLNYNNMNTYNIIQYLQNNTTLTNLEYNICNDNIDYYDDY